MSATRMQHLRDTFIEEARSLLQDMEALVLAIESGNADADALNALFRCSHTIKGSAGIFALDPIVDFAHVAESVLDRVRTGTVQFDGDLAALLLACRDHLESQIQAIADGRDLTDAAIVACGAELIARLNAYLDVSIASAASKSPAVDQGLAGVSSSAIGHVASDAWHISLRFYRDAFRHGINPPAFVAYLGELGQLLHVETLLNDMPATAEMDPESCYLRLEIDLRADCERAAIDSALEFLDGDCDVRVIAPRAALQEYVALIHALPRHEHLRLGEILVRSGALTRKELVQALQFQAATADAGGAPTRPLGQILVDRGAVPSPMVDIALQQQRRVEQHGGRGLQVLKIPSERLDHLIDLVGELVIASSATGTLAASRRDGELIESASVLQSLIEEIRDVSLRMRMVAIGSTFSRFQRAVRDIARELGKEIELSVSGAETELDKSMVELIGDPLMHLVRNAADHGIEAPALRRERGKPAAGRLSLNAFHDSGSVVIEVSDDGGGLDHDKIRCKAVESGLIDADAKLDEADIYRLIFEPGFSTASAVTSLSGRGVGMDVVKKNIEALRGTIDIESDAGRGTRVRLRLPLTLAIIDGFLVELAQAQYVIPLDMLVECLDLSAQDRAEIDQRGVINLRGSAVPVIHLRDLFGIGDDRPARENIVVVNYGGQRAGLAVDRLLGQLQVVIKPLPGLFRQVRGIGGSTILGNGRVAPILDIPGLLQIGASCSRSTAVAASTALSASRQAPEVF